MNKIINYLKTYLLFLIVLIIYLIVFSLIMYFELISYKTLNIINYIFVILLFFITGFRISNLERNKGYLNGFFISSILIILFTIISLILGKLNLSSLIYYISVILSSIFGGIIGVNKKTQ